MADLRFFERSLALSISEVVDITGAVLMRKQYSYPIIEDVAPLDSAGVGDVTFIENRK
ncbi:MAG: UDP-3-O-(3-hydroxymyristoyl)glucosamine N-acyltransferase, partial [Rhodospirillaceae bacterium]|nr:UDP-3-O-(3-hydroxymyristoyl)glucosamine N-acyltransferase [Rhodospirillaceae bacterium]